MNQLLGWDEYLPGEAYESALGRGYSPMDLVRLRESRARKFKSQDRGDYFQQFLALQQNPEALFSSAVDMPQTPFGRMM